MDSAEVHKLEVEAVVGALKNLPQCHLLYTEVSTVIISVSWLAGEWDPAAQ